MKKRYKQIKHRSEFAEMLAFKFNIKARTMINYLENETVPDKWKEKVSQAIEIQLCLDRKFAEIEKQEFRDI